MSIQEIKLLLEYGMDLMWKLILIGIEYKVLHIDTENLLKHDTKYMNFSRLSRGSNNHDFVQTKYECEQ